MQPTPPSKDLFQQPVSVFHQGLASIYIHKIPRLPDETVRAIHAEGFTDAQLTHLLRTFVIHSRDMLMSRNDALRVLEESGFRNPEVLVRVGCQK
jgi:hypothetical protein